MIVYVQHVDGDGGGEGEEGYCDRGLLLRAQYHILLLQLVKGITADTKPPFKIYILLVTLGICQGELDPPPPPPPQIKLAHWELRSYEQKKKKKKKCLFRIGGGSLMAMEANSQMVLTYVPGMGRSCDV